MQSNRRSFLQALGLGVAGLTLGWPVSQAKAQGGWNGRFLLYVHAGGGWDPTSFCDPKGREAAGSPDPMNNYLMSDIRFAGGGSPIRWAPIGDNDAFFQRYGERLLILNGLDTSTNGHDSGTRYAASGTLAETHPSIAAFYASVYAHDLSMPFISNGAYDSTRGLVSKTRIGNISALERLADTNDLGGSVGMLSRATLDRIERAQSEREADRLARNPLPREVQARAKRIDARATDSGIGRLRAELPNLQNYRTNLGRQGAVALAAWRAGVSASANVTTGGFDTHANNDLGQATALTNLTQGLDEILREIERSGATDQVTLIVGSDFGRTPGYNDGNGKDHWPVTSMMLLGAGVRGNRVLGGSTARHRPLTVDAQTLQPLPEGTPGLVLTPAHVHRALRTHLGLTGTEADRLYPIAAEELNFIG